MGVHKDGRNWYQIRWFSKGDTKEERRLILKLDLLIVPYAFLVYWTKYIDQANLSKHINAATRANRLNSIQTMLMLEA